MPPSEIREKAPETDPPASIEPTEYPPADVGRTPVWPQIRREGAPVARQERTRVRRLGHLRAGQCTRRLAGGNLHGVFTRELVAGRPAACQGEHDVGRRDARGYAAAWIRTARAQILRERFKLAADPRL